jgi:hypothetical protein
MTTVSLLAVVKSELPALAGDIRREHLACLESAGAAAEHAWKAGTLLLEAKQQVTHGQWEAWLGQTGIKPRTAQVYMRLAKAQRAAPPEGVSIRNALRGLAALDPVPESDGRRQRAGIPAMASQIKPTLSCTEWDSDPRECSDMGKGYTSPGDPTQMRDKNILRCAIKMAEAGFKELEREDHALVNKVTADWLMKLINASRPS